jgi:transcriptional regulator with XRE-family HTH domain
MRGVSPRLRRSSLERFLVDVWPGARPFLILVSVIPGCCANACYAASMATKDDVDGHRRAALGDFLRDRRERLRPEDVGLATRGRRRTPGLRREEVAALAGVSVTWYTWLEQGRRIQVSAKVLDWIGAALRLADAERSHLTALALGPPKRSASLRVPESIMRLLASLEQVPAYVVGGPWDVLAWNPAADALYGFTGRRERDRNVLRVVFLDLGVRDALVDWRRSAADTVARFRRATAGHAGEPWYKKFVEELAGESEDFGAAWTKLEVRERRAGKKTFVSPRYGTVSFEHHAFTVPENEQLCLVTYAPLAEDGSAGKLSRLVAARAAGRTTLTIVSGYRGNRDTKEAVR